MMLAVTVAVLAWLAWLLMHALTLGPQPTTIEYRRRLLDARRHRKRG